MELDSDCDHEEEDEALLGSGAPGQQSNHRLLGELPAVVNMLNTIGRSNSWMYVCQTFVL